MIVGLSDGRRIAVAVPRGAVPMDLALAFCREHGLTDDDAPVLADVIEAEINRRRRRRIARAAIGSSSGENAVDESDGASTLNRSYADDGDEEDEGLAATAFGANVASGGTESAAATGAGAGATFVAVGAGDGDVASGGAGDGALGTGTGS